MLAGTSRAVHKYRLFCATESNLKYAWSEAPPTACPTNAAHAIDPASVTVVDSLYENNAHVRGQYHGSFYSASVTPENKLAVDLPMSAFGLLKVQQDTPEIQVDFRYGLTNETSVLSSNGQGWVGVSNALVVLGTGAGSNSGAAINTRRFLRYSAGQGGNVMFTALFTPGVSGSTQLAGIGGNSNGLYFGYNGSNFGVMRHTNGTQHWTYQRDWNFDRMDGTGPSEQVLDHTKGNVYRIMFQWLGFGAIRYMVEDSLAGIFSTVHVEHYANSNAVEPTLHDPSFPIDFRVQNTTNTTPLTLRSACFCAMAEGIKQVLGLKFSADNTKVLSTTSHVSILAVRCRTTLNGFQHYVPVFLRLLSVGTDGTKNAMIYLIKDPVLGGSPSWADVKTSDSVVEYDTTSTTVTGGTQLAAFAVGKAESRLIDVARLNIALYPGTTLVVAGHVTATGSTEVTASLTWVEDR